MDGETESIQKSYAFGSLTIATRKDGALKWLLGDHLGSTSLTANADGTFFSELRYSAFEEIRYSSGTTPTDYRYTNQLSQESTGLYYYVARWYDPQLARFTQADTIVPGAGSPAAYDRYAYVLNNPIIMNDPTGHACSDDGYCVLTPGERLPNLRKNVFEQIMKVTYYSPPRDFLPPSLDPKVAGGFNYGDITGKDPNTGKDTIHKGQDINPPPWELQASSYGKVSINLECRLAECINLMGKEGGTSWEANLGFGNLLVVEYSYSLLQKETQEKVKESNSIYILYAHLVEPSNLQAGEYVIPGTYLGTIGSTGWSSGAHVHIETRQGPPGAITGIAWIPGKGKNSGITWYGEFKSLSLMDPNTLWAIEKQ